MKALSLLPTEEQEQRTLAEWLDLQRVCWFHPPNGGARTKAEAGVFRALGVKSGVPDVVILDPPPVWGDEFRGTAIELKRRDASPSATTEAQRQWLGWLEERHWCVAVCRGADEAIEMLEELGYGRRGG